MVKIYSIFKNHSVKKLIKENIVDLLKKKGKKLLELDLLKYSDKINNIKNTLAEIDNSFDYVIFYSDFLETLATECDIVIVFNNECLLGPGAKLNTNNILIAFWDETLFGQIDSHKSKIIDIGFLASNTVNITHLSCNEDNSIDLSLFFQRSFTNINGEEIINQEINERYLVENKKIHAHFYPLLTTLKVFLNLI